MYHRIVIVIAIIIIIVIAFATTTTSTLPTQVIGDDSVSIAHVTFDTDASVVVSGESIIINDSTLSSAGDTTATAVEPTTSLPVLRTALTDDNYSYTFLVKEVSGTCPDCWLNGKRIRIRVWGIDTDGAPDTDDLTSGGDGGLYISQSSEEAGVEGVQVSIDLGTNESKYESFDLLIDWY